MTSTTGATTTALETPVTPEARTTQPSTKPTARTRTSIAPAAAPGTTATAGATATVTKVVDGDTMKVDVGGRSETVRVIGIDTPETGSGTGVECFSPEATSRASALAEGSRVRLEPDPSQGAQDRYGRTLAHVVLDDGRIFAEVMLGEGAAREYTHDRPYRYRQEFRAAEAGARSAGRGLWAGCGASTSSTAPRVAPRSTTSTTPYSGGTRPGPPASPTSTAPAPEPSGDRDCPDFATRAEAQRYFESRGGPGADPDRLDRDGDGQVCESLG